jgi:hypothetical protein
MDTLTEPITPIIQPGAAGGSSLHIGYAVNDFPSFIFWPGQIISIGIFSVLLRHGHETSASQNA